jgi:hypothetical protein
VAHNAAGNDEQVETTNGTAWKDAYYELKVDGHSVFTDEHYDSATAVYHYTLNKADVGLDAGGEVVFNKDTGVVSWSPNNRDVGNHTFTVTHYDGHGGEDTKTFATVVANAQPSIIVPTDGSGNHEWTFREDAWQDPAADHNLYIIDASLIGSNDEGQGATYHITVWKDGTPITIDPVHGTQINDGGGLLTFDEQTGRIEWHTNNADVTRNTGGAEPNGPYRITIEVDDNTGKLNSTNTTDIFLHVDNDPTSINVTLDHPTTLPDGTPLVTMDEDTTFSVPGDHVTSRDELVGAGTYYTLDVTRAGDTTHDVTYYNAHNGFGADIGFNSATGEITSWSPTNRDVGLYTFQVTHHDGHNSEAQTTFAVDVKNVAPLITTEPEYKFGTTAVVPATKYFTYDVNSTDEGQHDWKVIGSTPVDQVTYTLVKGIGNMTIDSHSGLIHWWADPKVSGGPYEIVIRVDDGNGGSAVQTFQLIVDDFKGDLPIEVRPDSDDPAHRHEDLGPPDLDVGPLKETGPMGGLYGVTPMTKMPGALVPDQVPLPLPEGKLVEEILKTGSHGIEDLIAGLGEHDLKQPSLDKAGSVSPITPLGGYPTEIMHGKKIHFSAEEVALVETLKQPGLDISGSESPETPLEGYIPGIEAGKRLNFGYFPIRETMSLKLEDMRAGDLLGF